MAATDGQQHRVAAVTGASGAIGLAIARQLAAVAPDVEAMTRAIKTTLAIHTLGCLWLVATLWWWG